jgi:hypothetical protein
MQIMGKREYTDILRTIKYDTESDTTQIRWKAIILLSFERGIWMTGMKRG